MVAVSFLGPLVGVLKGGAAFKAAGLTAAALGTSHLDAQGDALDHGSADHGAADHADHHESGGGGEHEEGGDHHEEPEHDHEEHDHEEHEHEEHEDHENHEDGEGEDQGGEAEDLEQTEDNAAEEVEVANGAAARSGDGAGGEEVEVEDGVAARSGGSGGGSRAPGDGGLHAVEDILKVVAAASAVASATSRLVEGRSRDLGMPWLVGRSCGSFASLGLGVGLPRCTAPPPPPPTHASGDAAAGGVRPGAGRRSDEGAGPWGNPSERLRCAF